MSYYCKNRGINKDWVRVDNPVDCPDTDKIESWQEAIMTATIMAPAEYTKSIKALCQDKRGVVKSEDYISDGKLITMVWDIPLSELITDFFDRMKSLSQGYASLDYEHSHWQDAVI